ncbi:peptidylprolyl isomerase [Paenibacillus ginsengarvi]|uniref:peptidylprolyl isomerase n=1 Tax=Paenibacillus ginsengarvi TaxID=400777 RepID=A0A3B0AZR3_9BACL|nr:peptidylprolyl isomerase [Paenibacillus ginsengarvi]RKN65748.1 peptidylprolyl isomerase [Paenibacillus ginsengarvi]
MLPTNRSKTKRRLSVILAAVVVAAVALTGCGKDKNSGAAAGSTEVVATYKDGKVTKGEYNSFVGSVKFFNPMYAQFETDPTFQDYMMKQLIAFKVLGDKADAASKKDAEAKTKDQIDQIKNYFAQQGDKNAFDTQLKAANLTQDDIKDYILKSLVVLGDAEKKVTDDQVKTKYDENSKANAYTIATVSHVLVSLKDANQEKEIRTKDEALKRAQEVKTKLDGGADFAAIAKEYSDDGGSKDNGGKYENASVGDWVENFKKAAIELPIGKISDPVETEFGYHVMKVETRSNKTLDEMKEQIKSELAEQQVSDYIEKDLPGIIEKIETDKLPKAAPAPAGDTSAPNLTQPAAK